MAFEPNKYALAGIGIVETVRQKIEGLIDGDTGEEKEVETASTEGSEKKSFEEHFEDLVELGEERYDDILDRVKKERETLSEKIREQLGEIFSKIGLVTKEDIDILDSKLNRLEKMTKKMAH